jgi:hypothetical protein
VCVQQKSQYLAKFMGENIFKIITSVPGRKVFWYNTAKPWKIYFKSIVCVFNTYVNALAHLIDKAVDKLHIYIYHELTLKKCELR